jgi:hypothetical protein
MRSVIWKLILEIDPDQSAGLPTLSFERGRAVIRAKLK